MTGKGMNELEDQLRSDLAVAVTLAPRLDQDRAPATAHDDFSRRTAHLTPLLCAAAVVAIVAVGAVWTQWPVGDNQSRVAVADGPRPSMSAPASPAVDLEKTLANLSEFENQLGYAGISVADGGKSVTLQWAGTIPGDVRALEGTVDSGVLVTIDSVAYSERQLRVGASALTSAAAVRGIHISGSGPAPARDGLELLVDRTRSSANVKTAAEALLILNAISDVAIVDLEFGGGVGTWPGPSAD